MQGEYLAAFRALLKEFQFCLPEYIGPNEEATLYTCFYLHMKQLAETRARVLSAEHGTPYEMLETLVESAFGEHRNPFPIICPKGYETPDEMKQCSFSWRLDYLAVNQDEMRRLGMNRGEQ